MHLIAPLVSGIAGAEDGSARIVRRGTTVPSTLYSSFEGDAFASSSLDADGDVVLDSHGRVEVYVGEVSDVTVYNADGEIQITFTAGFSAAGIEVRSPSFTGNSYDGSSSNAQPSLPTTLQSILNLWVTAQGAVDWGMSAMSLPFIVVTNAPYGAVGDGSTDDTIALQAALADAGSGGSSLVYVPEGTYRVTDTLTVLPGVVLFGTGTIQMNHPTNGLLSVGTARVFGLYFTSTGTGTVIDSSGRTHMTQCTIEGQGKLISASDILRLDTCTLTAEAFSDGEEFIELTSGSAEAHAAGCTFSAPTGGYTPVSGAMVTGNNLYFNDCTFRAPSTTSGTFSYVQFNTGIIQGSITESVFGAASGAFVTALELGAYAGTSRFYESDNAIPGGVTAYSYTASVNTSGVQLRTRETRVLRVDDNSATVAIPTDQYGIVIVTSTHAAPVMTGTLPPFGARGSVVFYHPSGGVGTAQPTTNFFGSTAVATADTGTLIWEYVCSRSNSALRMLITVDGHNCGAPTP